MSRRQYLRIVIAPDGACTVDAINFTGPACQSATMEIANALGTRVIAERQKPEARVRNGNSQSDREATR